MSNSVKIRIENISKSFILSRVMKVTALNKINFDIHKNEFLSVVGPSGCGKSTLLFIISGLLKPTEGNVYIDGEIKLKPSIKHGIVFQGDVVFPWYSVRKNIEYGPRQRGLPENEVKKISDQFLKIVGLEKYEKAWPSQLSGGMRKRVDVARALANNPEVLLMDEPFGSLDVITKQNLQIEINKIFTNLKITIFFVTHDLEEAIFLSDRVVVMSKQPGTIKTIVDIDFERPRSVDIKTSKEFQELRRKLNSFIEI